MRFEHPNHTQVSDMERDTGDGEDGRHDEDDDGGDWTWGQRGQMSGAEADMLELITHAEMMPHARCTREVVGEIVELLEEGHYIETVCDFVGVSQRSYYNWLDKGRAELERLAELVEFGEVAVVDPARIPHVVLVQLSARARATAHMKAMRRVTRSAQGRAPEGADVKASIWFLERSLPHVWGGRQTVDVNVSGGVELELIVERPLDAEFTSDDDAPARVVARYPGDEGEDEGVALALALEFDGDEAGS